MNLFIAFKTNKFVNYINYLKITLYKLIFKLLYYMHN